MLVDKTKKNQPSRLCAVLDETCPGDASARLPGLGTGLRARHLDAIGDYAYLEDVARSHACENRLGSRGPYGGQRFCKAFPPYLKWPIWLPRPKRQGEAPNSFCELFDRTQRDDGAANVTKRFFDLTNIPRVCLEVSYLRTELGTQDRRTCIALSDHAVETGKDPECGAYRIKTSVLRDKLGILRTTRNRSDIPASLWRMSGAIIHLNYRDPLKALWGSQSFAVLPAVMVRKIEREYEILYDFPEPANQLIAAGSMCTVDNHRLRYLKSPVSETLYLLLYDIAQWSSLPSVAFSVTELAVRLGLTVYSYQRKSTGRQYQNWAWVVTRIRHAIEEMAVIAGFVRDYLVEGDAAATTFTFLFATANCRKGHFVRN